MVGVLRIALLLVLATATAACSASPVYPGARLQAAGRHQAYATSDSFGTVYSWYKQHLPAGTELSHATRPQQAVFFTGRGNHGRKVTIMPSPRCCATLILVADANT